MADGNGHSRISVSEETLKRVLAEFKLELVKELQSYASRASVESLGREVQALREYVAGAVAVSKYQRWLLGSIVVVSLGALSTLIWLAVGNR